MAAVKLSRNNPVPVLLSEFPIPPSFIPQNISQAANPPPSRPPSLPLPPIPGPSPLSENDLYQISAAARSRRTSRLSTSSNSSSWRGSVASNASVGSRPPSLTVSVPPAVAFLHPGRNRTESVHSTRSNTSLPSPLFSYSTARAANPDLHPPPISKAVNPAILEDDESLDPVEPSLTLTSLSDIPGSSHPHVDDDEPTIHGERLSSIDMRDLPALLDDDITHPSSQAHSLHQPAHVSQPKSPTHKSRIRQAMPRPQPQPNGSSTGGKAHRRTSSTTQHAQNRESSYDASEAPTQGKSLPDGSDRASSPDVASILAATPRPRRRSETSSSGSRSGSQSRRRPPKSLPGSRRTSSNGRLSVFSLPDQQARQGSAYLTSRSLLPYADNADEADELWNDDSLLEDYGVVIGSANGHFANVPDEDDVSGDSDSSLDLHTPLPSLMLRDGLLSPHSKLLPQNIASDPPLVAMDGNRHGSVVSAKTKSGVFKDERDTTRRRVRHRDGRLLRGGIGLTTGLGWSDSEDEDAPSPLTRRLSHMALSRQSSVASLKSAPRSSRSHPHPLSRSFSGDAKVYSSNSIQNLKRPALPPTSWQSRTRTVTSTQSLSIPEQDRPDPASTLARFSEPPPFRVDIPVDSQRNEQVRTPSSSSTQSLLGPITPDMTDVPGSVKPWGREKNLPPIPLSRASSLASLRPMESFSDMKNRPARLITPTPKRPISSESELSDPPIVSPHTPKLSNPHTPTFSSARTPRPLQLSASLGSGLQPGEPASMQGLLLGYNRQLHDQQRARTSSGQSPTAPTGHRYSVRHLSSSRSGSVDLSLSELGEPRLRPRTGTGMTYKKSSTSLTRAAADVQAQSRVRMASERTAVAS